MFRATWEAGPFFLKRNPEGEAFARINGFMFPISDNEAEQILNHAGRLAREMLMREAMSQAIRLYFENKKEH